MSAWSIRARLMAWYLGVLMLAMIVLAVGSWWLFGRSLIVAADRSLAGRIDGVHRFIDSMQRQLPKEELQDELNEYGDLSAGESLLEVEEDTGGLILRPALADWAAIRMDAPESAGMVFADRVSTGRPFRVVAATFSAAGHHYRVVAAMAMGPGFAAWTRLGWLLALLVPIVALGVAAGGYVISNRALAPVDRMTRAVQDISVRNLDRRLDVPAPNDELRRLAVTFNAMLERLNASVGEMARFTADAAHELRTPVALIRATADVTLARPRAAEEYREALAEVLAHSERMSLVVVSLLALARADAGVEPMASTDVRAAAEAAARDVHSGLTKKQQTLTLDLPVPVSVLGVPDLLHRLLVILLDNAVKYTPDGGTLRLRVSSTGDREAGGDAIVEVTDSGPGVAPADAPHVFDRFYRGAHARATAEGSGLGLALARAIVERHGGSITLGFVERGAGCRVEVRMPIQSPGP